MDMNVLPIPVDPKDNLSMTEILQDLIPTEPTLHSTPLKGSGAEPKQSTSCGLESNMEVDSQEAGTGGGDPAELSDNAYMGGAG